ncbi:hypothetical protein GO988_18910 [Hymenobacter sp. HMF4947]|uniref:Glycosyltransferase RgtA/B/C/D-like domain-containing protein n=1 Tax=Hymenobacter ginkgonis TaxID=2682976 RepID=A0A7K1TJ93_9BACT|nr:hypothetical protein [Hymenobacter ginkgonis]MVN78406.1 hypothetical protein [Hymenobacter ginkgonis]
MQALAGPIPGWVRRWLLPWALGLGLLLNLAYPMYRHYDFSHSLDTRSYLRLAAGRFDSVNVTRRYRVLVPLAAGALARPLAVLGSPASSPRPAGEWPLRLAFYLVNCLLLSAAGTLWYRAARLAGAGAGAAAVALAAVLSSRWAEYAAGLPLTDSLYLLVFGLSYYAWRRGLVPGRVGAGWAVALALFLGPLAKESFVFLAPWAMWYGRRALGWRGQAVALAAGVLALAAVHYFLDKATGSPPTATVTNALSHVDNLTYSLRRAASVKGVGELFSIFGLFGLLVLAAALHPAGRQVLAPVLRPAEVLLLAVVLVHMLLSGDLGRMGYLSAPLFTVALALAIEALGKRVVVPGKQVGSGGEGHS